MSDSLFEKLGGEAAVDAAVDIFYRKVLADERISEFFEGVDMEQQVLKQKAFLTMAFGGPNSYSGQELRAGHAHLVEKGLDDSHFDAVAENLVASLTELKVSDGLIDEVIAIVGPTRDDVLGKETDSEVTDPGTTESKTTNEEKDNAWVAYLKNNGM